MRAAPSRVRTSAPAIGGCAVPRPAAQRPGSPAAHPPAPGWPPGARAGRRWPLPRLPPRARHDHDLLVVQCPSSWFPRAGGCPPGLQLHHVADLHQPPAHEHRVSETAARRPAAVAPGRRDRHEGASLPLPQASLRQQGQRQAAAHAQRRAGLVCLAVARGIALNQHLASRISPLARFRRGGPAAAPAAGRLAAPIRCLRARAWRCGVARDQRARRPRPTVLQRRGSLGLAVGGRIRGARRAAEIERAQRGEGARTRRPSAGALRPGSRPRCQSG